MKYDISDLTLKGEMVTLKPLHARHFKQFTEWYDKKRMRRHLLRDDLPGFANRIRAFLIPYCLRRVISSIYRHWLDNGMGFIIKVRNENIGTICAWEISQGIFRIQIMIGRRKNWGQGFGTEALRCLRDYLFMEHHPSQLIGADIHPGNKRCIKMLTSNGFRLCSEAEIDHYREITKYPRHLIDNPYTDSGRKRLQAYVITADDWKASRIVPA